MISRNDQCFCNSGKKWKKCHYPQLPPKTFNEIREEYSKKYHIILKSSEEIKGIRLACKLAANILKKLCNIAKEGVTTKALDDYSAKLHQEANAVPAPLNYGDPPFPAGICTSLNDVICHGIPNNTPLKDGDILNIDVTCKLNGYFGDCSSMVVIGSTDEGKRRVIDVSKTSLYKALDILKPGVMICEIGNVIEDYATSQHCSVVNQFVAHGVGLNFHEAPQIHHNYNDMLIPLAPGMTFTIEPMINLGQREAIIDPVDQWTARTLDGLPSAQFEHTVLITETGHEILTVPD